MKLRYYLMILFLVHSSLSPMESDLTDDDSNAPKEQQEKTLVALSNAAAKKKRKKSHPLIQELTEEELAILQETNMEVLSKKHLKKIKMPISNEVRFVKDIYLEPGDTEYKEEVTLTIPNGHFALCFYTQLEQAQHALITISPNSYLTESKGEYNFLNNPHHNHITEFLKTFPRNEIKKYVQILIGTDLNLKFCHTTEKSFEKDLYRSFFHFYDLKQVTSSQKMITIKIYRDLDEYVSFCSVTNEKGTCKYLQSLSDNLHQPANPDLKK